MITIVKDIDLIDHLDEYDIILVGTNLYCTMSQGFQLKVMLDYHYVYEKNLESKYGDKDKLGTLLECSSDGEPTFCLCFITEGYNFRPDIYKDKKVACTLLGNSRFDGNGDKDKILSIFNDTIKDLDLTIYDYYQKSRHEEMKEVREKELEVKKEDSEAYYKMVRERKKKADERFRKNGHRRY